MRASGVVCASTTGMSDSRTSHLPPLKTSYGDGDSNPAFPTYPRCQHTFRVRIGLVGHLRTQCTNNPTIPTFTSNSAKPPADSPTLIPGINSITPTILETTSLYSSPVTSTTAGTAATVTTTTTTTSDGGSLLNSPYCNRKFTSRIGLVGQLRIHRTETGEPAYYRNRRLVRQRIREMQDACMARKAEEIQGYVNHKEWKNFFNASKAVQGPPVKGAVPLPSADGTAMLTEKSQILKCWAEHF
ncbi:unnamed protein product [Schistocephalus solidus]|uniref:C2H2-type domain-containing protein n=1 Tax=Schistocephalus solidus TaxID=70667 RepID=A0A183T2Y8_SCHSO|nr:unnamed protein product [Schistocephalus solidus]